MKTLFFCGAAPPTASLRRDGLVVVALTEAAARALERAGVAHKSVAELLGPETADALDEAAMAWTKTFGRTPLVDGRPFRDLLAWKGLSLWWFAEIYLYHCTRAPGYVRQIETFSRVLDHERPDEVEGWGLALEDEVLLGRLCTARGILFHGRRRVPRARLARRTLCASLTSRWNTVKLVVTCLKAALSGAPPRPPETQGRMVLFVSHAAFWRVRDDPTSGRRSAYEHYFDRLIPEVDAAPGLRAFVVAVGPRAAFRRRSWRDRVGDWLRPHAAGQRYVHINRYTRPAVVRETLRATGEIRQAWRRIGRASGLHEAFSHRGVAFDDLCAPDLASMLLQQLPWAVRSIEETTAALGAIRPDLVCLYAESSGWGRAILASCRAAGVPTVALQHGILYPKYFSYRHAPDEGACPRPDATAVFGESARRLLAEIGGYAPDSLVATGNPKFDDLVRRSATWSRAELRQRLGVGPAERLLVVASRFRAITDIHRAIGPVFPAFVEAVETLPGVVAVVKPHPAEAAAAYEAVLRDLGATRVRLLPPSTDLMELLHGADALVTVESATAVEALILGRPIVVLNMPSHLAELVELGVALGVPATEAPAAALRSVLYDDEVRARLHAARELYVSDLTLGADGGATDRILALLRTKAGNDVRGSVRTS